MTFLNYVYFKSSKTQLAHWNPTHTVAGVQNGLVLYIPKCLLSMYGFLMFISPCVFCILYYIHFSSDINMVSIARLVCTEGYPWLSTHDVVLSMSFGSGLSLDREGEFTGFLLCFLPS